MAVGDLVSIGSVDSEEVEKYVTHKNITNRKKEEKKRKKEIRNRKESEGGEGC